MTDKKTTDASVAPRVAERYAMDMFAMSNLRSTDTGVEGAVIWVSVGEFAGADLQHGPRIKVLQGNKITKDGLKDAVSVRLTDPPEVLGTLPAKLERQVVAFVNRNRDTLLRYWNEEISTREMLDLIERV
jgi:hypothetical protein